MVTHPAEGIYIFGWDTDCVISCDQLCYIEPVPNRVSSSLRTRFRFVIVLVLVIVIEKLVD